MGAFDTNYKYKERKIRVICVICGNPRFRQLLGFAALYPTYVRLMKDPQDTIKNELFSPKSD